MENYVRIWKMMMTTTLWAVEAFRTPGYESIQELFNESTAMEGHEVYLKRSIAALLPNREHSTKALYVLSNTISGYHV
ncbi:hypothetical protein Fmac_003218 [Flemingia macrophylla]|uniref:Uncharacterized protein n=1 Tax=Flemingia macrophylla TaxID=520843 RepID=A0ABD1NP08_9FABA